MADTHPARTVESLVPSLLASCRTPSSAFVDLCCTMLSGLGFTAVHQRSGTEQGRDIDAELGGLRYFFECKFAHDRIATPPAAYKLTQLDMLAPSGKPHVFVYLSNARPASLLKDIITSRADIGDYDVELWCNDVHDRRFDELLLACAPDVLRFLSRVANPLPSDWQVLASDFLTRSRQVPPTTLTRRRVPRSSGAVARLAMRDASRALQQAERAWRACGPDGLGLDPLGDGSDRATPGLLLVAAPLGDSGGFDFGSFRSRQTFAEGLAGWGMVPSHDTPQLMLFREPLSADDTRTLFSAQGEIVTYSHLMEAGGRCLRPDEWLALLKEDCLRMRNYSLADLLPAPFAMTMRLYMPKGYEVVGGLDRLRREEEAPSPDATDRPAPSDGVIRGDIAVFDAAPRTPAEVALGVLPSFWKRAGFDRPILSHLQSVVDQVLFEPSSSVQSFWRVVLTAAWTKPGTDDRPFEDYPRCQTSAGPPGAGDPPEQTI